MIEVNIDIPKGEKAVNVNHLVTDSKISLSYELKPSCCRFPTLKDTDFKIGDEVKIINTGLLYTTYRAAFKTLGFDNYDINYASLNDTGRIFAITKHEDYYGTKLFAIALNNGKQCLIGKEGIAKIFSESYDEGDVIVVGELVTCILKNIICTKYINNTSIYDINIFCLNKNSKKYCIQTVSEVTLRKAFSSERECLFNEIEKLGLKWNPDTKSIEKIRIDLTYGTPVMVSDNNNWVLRNYAYKENAISLHGGAAISWNYIIPVNKFNFEDQTFNEEDNYGSSHK